MSRVLRHDFHAAEAGLGAGPEHRTLNTDHSGARGLLAIGSAGPEVEVPSFAARLRAEGIDLRRGRLETLQVNVGKLCNQACHHCHVDAGPARTEVMTLDTVERVLAFLEASDVTTVDITGGAPEVNPHFRHLVARARGLGRRVMVRCNLTVLFEPGQEDLPDFYRAQNVELVCSLPCYLEENVDAQRGRGVFEKSIRALRALNDRGFGRPGSGLLLHLVYNPVGAVLPPPQEELAADYREALLSRYGIVFNELYTITNMPINRFGDQLRRRGELDGYLQLLRDSFNGATVPRLMCRTLLSVAWTGDVFDCDFNQMLDMHAGGRPVKLWSIDPTALPGRGIRVGDHCFGCTAGAGSSCGGGLV